MALRDTISAALGLYGPVQDADISLWTRALGPASDEGLDIEGAFAAWARRSERAPIPLEIITLAHDSPDTRRWQNLLGDVARRHGLLVDDILTLRRGSASATVARQAAMAALRDAGLSLPAIGRLLHRDPATVLHGIRAHRDRCGDA